MLKAVHEAVDSERLVRRLGGLVRSDSVELTSTNQHCGSCEFISRIDSVQHGPSPASISSTLDGYGLRCR